MLYDTDSEAYINQYYLYDGYKNPYNGLFSIGTDEPYFAGTKVDIRR